jgi:DNA uptake protein ComE-like DNA-binding protein
MRKYFVCALLVVALCSLGFAQAAAPADKAKPAAPAADKAKPATEKAPAAKPAAKPKLVDINKATKEQLVGVGFDEATAQKIIDGRPYKMKSDLKTKKIIDEATYKKVSPKIIASGAKPAGKPKPTTTKPTATKPAATTPAPAEKPKQ